MWLEFVFFSVWKCFLRGSREQKTEGTKSFTTHLNPRLPLFLKFVIKNLKLKLFPTAGFAADEALDSQVFLQFVEQVHIVRSKSGYGVDEKCSGVKRISCYCTFVRPLLVLKNVYFLFKSI